MRQRNTGSLVMDAHMNNGVCGTNAYRHRCLLVGIFDSVVQQIAEGLTQAFAIPVAGNGDILYVRCKGMMTGDGAQLLYHLFCQCDDIARFALQGELARGETCGIKQVIDDAIQSLRLTNNNAGAALDSFFAPPRSRNDLSIGDNW